jgi:hypothetical protein
MNAARKKHSDAAIADDGGPEMAGLKEVCRQYWSELKISAGHKKTR